MSQSYPKLSCLRLNLRHLSTYPNPGPLLLSHILVNDIFMHLIAQTRKLIVTLNSRKSQFPNSSWIHLFLFISIVPSTEEFHYFLLDHCNNQKSYYIHWLRTSNPFSTFAVKVIISSMQKILHWFLRKPQCFSHSNVMPLSSSFSQLQQHWPWIRFLNATIHSRGLNKKWITK